MHISNHFIKKKLQKKRSSLQDKKCYALWKPAAVAWSVQMFISLLVVPLTDSDDKAVIFSMTKKPP